MLNLLSSNVKSAKDSAGVLPIPELLFTGVVRARFWAVNASLNSFCLAGLALYKSTSSFTDLVSPIRSLKSSDCSSLVVSCGKYS